MWSDEEQSDLDIEEESHDHVAGRWIILVDLYSLFQGEFTVFLFLAFLVPGLLVASAFFEWTQQPLLALAIAAVVFIICMTVSLHAYIWFRWVKKSERRAFGLMQEKQLD